MTAPVAPAAAAGGELAFETDIRPILKASCFHCHGEDGVAKGGLDVRLVRLMIEGGDSGAALAPGDPGASLLWELVESDEMPEKGRKLAPEEKDRIRRWIAQGARTLRPEPANPEEARFTLEELNHWAFQPVVATTPPPGEGNPIDAFVGARLAEAGLGFSPEGDRRTLLRRLSFDVTGLPPTVEETEAFLADGSADDDAWARQVDRLLASPAFGVRWARHWLDAAGFAESDGAALGDPGRPHAWRYRDYVVDAFNANKPIDAFLTEQLAGDEMIEGEPDVANPRHLELLTATGFLRMAPDPTGRSNSLADRNTATADALKVVSTSLLGLTVGCAQCHDHKSDPIGIDDYYRFRAVFDPVFPLENWQPPGNRLVDLTPPDVAAERDRIEAEAKALEDELEARRREHGATIQEAKLADVPGDVREEVRAAVLAAPNERSDRQRELLELYPMVKPVDFILGLLVEYDGEAYRRFEEERKKVAAVRATKPPQRLVMATTEPAGAVPVSKVFFRGDPESPREAVHPAELTVLRRHRPEGEPVIPENDPDFRTTGRRLAYARQLTDGSHPLTARVFVNRVWMHHFGRGLVATPGDFGIGGDPPSHPALLDWLADDFMRHGWDQKRLHRMILLSKTYRQSSRRRPELDAVDPENALLGRANLRRLEAEAIRDAVLAVTGRLDPAIGGPSGAVTANAEGKAVLGGDERRRSLFIEVQRRLPLHVLATFDQPEMTPNCDRRRQTTVATQALWFLNDEEMVAHSEALARLLAEASPDPAEQRRQLFLRLFGEPPSEAEHRACERFLADQRGTLREHVTEDEVDHLALASLCQVLLASNRFLYLD